jgi:uncharacterized protein DUF4396
MHQAAAGWLQVVAWVSLGVAAASAAAIAHDIAARGYRQQMAIMNLVWPITALYWGPVAAWAYFRRGKRMSHRWAREHDVSMDELMSGDAEDPPGAWPFARANWWPISKGVSHCGAGCTLGDVCGEWLVYLTGFSIGLFASTAANDLMAMFALDFAFAWAFGIAFQYFSIVPMRDDLGPLGGVWAAIKADTLSIVAFQIGLFGFMALYHLVLWQPPLSVASPTYWWMMQVGMVVGFFTAWPVNAWLVRRGWKEKM